MTGGVLRGVGKQLIGALCNLVGYYFIGFPIGVALMFAANMGIVGEDESVHMLHEHVSCLSGNPLNSSLISAPGLWAGLSVCVITQAIFFISFVCKLDWNKAAEEVRTAIPSPLYYSLLRQPHS